MLWKPLVSTAGLMVSFTTPLPPTTVTTTAAMAATTRTPRLATALFSSSSSNPVTGGGGGSSPVVVTPMYILRYHYVPDILTKRAPHRAGHLALANDHLTKGEIVLGGALADPCDEALLIFTNKEAAESFPKKDPYVLNGLVTSWSVREWSVVLKSSKL